jgi:thymidylate synthase
MKQYLDLLKHVLANGESHDDRTGVGTLSVFGYQIRFNLREGFPLVTTKKLPFRWIAEELFWFLSGDTYEPNLAAKGVDIWKEWATPEQCAKFGRDAGDLGPVYGWLWRNFGGLYGKYDAKRVGGVDQIARLLRDLEQNPGSRRHIVSGWDPHQCDKVALPPCHTLFQFKVHRDGALSCHLYARSIDSFLGLPFNIASYALLTELIAHVTSGIDPRELIISFGDLHIYKNHIEQVEEQLSREPYALPELEIFDWDGKFKGLEGLLQIRWEDLNLHNYKSHGKIAAPVAI